MGANFAAALNRYIHTKTKKLNKKTEEKINKALHKLGAETRDKIREYLTNGWYSTYTPKSYHRTHGVWESVTYVVSGHTVRVYFDMRMLRGKTVNKGRGWQVHRDFEGVDFTSGLVSWIEDGGVGAPTNPRSGHSGVHMIQQTREWLDKYLDKKTRKIIGEILKESGLAR